MRYSTLALALVLLLVSHLGFVSSTPTGNEEDQNDEDTKRLGRQKKKVDGKLYASYGLSPHVATPAKVVNYSKAAVSAASSSSSSSSSSTCCSSKSAAAAAAADAKLSQQANISGGEPSAPGTQAKVDLRPYMSAVENQHQSNSCAANAVAGAYEYLATRAALRDGEDSVGEISRLFIYYVGRKRDQQQWGENTWKKPKDEGMTLGSAIEAVQLKGAALQSSWPFDLDHVNTTPDKQVFEEAMRYKVGDAMSISLDLNQMRQCLSDGYPIIFGLKLTQAFFQPPFDAFIPAPDPSDPKSASHGLHAMLLVGYNDRQRVFIVRNSWGTDWGVDGYAYLSYDYVGNSEFNFVGMYAIQSLTDDDLTPDEDDGGDIDFDHSDVDPLNTSPYVELELNFNEFDDHFDLMEPDEDEDDLDADDMFDSKAEARRAFVQFAGNVEDMSIDNLLLSKQELYNALLLMGVPMVTQAEVDWAFQQYDDDKSNYITFEEFLDMQGLFDGSLLKRQRKLTKIKQNFKSWAKKMKKFLTGSGSGSGGGGGGSNDNNVGL